MKFKIWCRNRAEADFDFAESSGLINEDEVIMWPGVNVRWTVPVANLVSGSLLLPWEQKCRICRGGKCAHEAVGVQEHEGIQDADFVLYVGALATERCSHENIISYAAYCQQEATMDR